MKPLSCEIPYHSALELFDQISEKKGAIFLDSATSDEPFQKTNRYSYVMFDPIELFTLKHQDPFPWLKNYLAAFKTEKIKGLPPFQGGLAGYFSYDLCHYLETLPAASMDNMNAPDLAVGIYDVVFSFDHVLKKAWIVSTGFPEQENALRVTRAKQRLEEMLLLMRAEHKPLVPAQPPSSTIDIRANFTQAQYMQAVNTIKEYILSGDVFEVNLSQQFSAKLPTGVTPYQLYKQLRAINPAPFAAYLNMGEVILASASPERFLSLTGKKVETRPIKGTRARGKTPEADAFAANELLHSEKDKAENVMIVDLMRNDLSRVCVDDSIEVTALCALESYASVHHLVSVIHGQLKKAFDAVDLLKATMPGGSITGAPKIRAMEIIAQLEPNQRGPYCGNIGFISFTGEMDLSIVIRTYVIKDGVVTFQVGGAVVLDSDPAQEYQETLDKAYALNAALGKI